jgi:hypothetical protein
MNALAERPHSTIGNALRAMLYSSGLDTKNWNYAFYHYLRLYNVTPHANNTKTPYESVKGKKPDLSKLRIFGCHVYIRPPGQRPSKLDIHANKGIFLGYTSTLQQIYYLDLSTNTVKIAAHARFDEGMSSLPLEQLPPFALAIRKALGHAILESNEQPIAAPDDIDLYFSRPIPDNI